MLVFLETDRLVLRPFTPDDTENLVELDSDPDVMLYVTGGRITPREEIGNDVLPAFLDYYRRDDGYGFWAAIEKSTSDFLGWFHFRPAPDDGRDEAELGYRLRRSAWGKGYAAEGSRALIRKGFTDSAYDASMPRRWPCTRRHDGSWRRPGCDTSGLPPGLAICDPW